MNGHITISRPWINDGSEYINIALKTEEHKALVEIKMTLDNFARAITGLGSVDCVYHTDGKIHRGRK